MTGAFAPWPLARWIIVLPQTVGSVTMLGEYSRLALSAHSTVHYSNAIIPRAWSAVVAVADTPAIVKNRGGTVPEWSLVKYPQIARTRTRT
jgi:hypothetical protein